MSEYIDRDLTVQKIVNIGNENYEGKYPNIGMVHAAQIVKSMPSADVAPVIHGKWIEKDDDLYCSECNHQIADCAGNATVIFVPENKFCYYCGAKKGNGEITMFGVQFYSTPPDLVEKMMN